MTGAGGVLGRAISAYLAAAGDKEILAPCRRELDLLDQTATENYISHHRPTEIIHLAATVFGLAGNMKNQIRAVFENSAINHNLFSAILKNPVERFFFAGTVASYPFPYARMPLKEDDFFAGLPHSGEFGYAMAKRHAYSYLRILREEAGMDFSYGIFTNLYGEHDRFDVDSGHVIPSLVSKAHRAAALGEALRVWGDGSAERDFLHVEDAAHAVSLVMRQTELPELVNISSGQAVTVSHITHCIATAAGVENVIFDVDKPVGIRRRVVDNTRLRSFGFSPKVSIEDGLSRTYRWFAENQVDIRQ